MKLELPEYPRSAGEQILVILSLGILSLTFAILALGCQNRPIPPEFISVIEKLLLVVIGPVAFDKLTTKRG